MKALVLAAGQGTRLLPLTADRPKCLVDFLGRTVLDHILRALGQAGVEDVVVVAGYQADMVRATGARVLENPRYASTNMVATLFCAEPEFPKDEDLIISYGDIIFEPRMVEALMACDAPVALAVNTRWQSLWEKRFEDPLSDAETLKMDRAGRLLELGRTPTSLDEIEAQYTGLIKVRADAINSLRRHYADLRAAAGGASETFDNMYMTDFIQSLIDAGWHVQTVPVDGGWLEIDSVEDRDVYEAWARSGELDDTIRL